MKIFGMAAGLVLSAAAVSSAQVPTDIATRLRQIGPVVDPAATAALYRPLHPRAPYPTVTVTRDLSYGPDPQQIMDLFAPVSAAVAPAPAPAVPVASATTASPAVPVATAGPVAPAIRTGVPVLVYVSGGPGNKIEPVPGGDAFYDNIMLWAAANDMIGVNVQRLATPGRDATDAARDIALVVDWIQRNIARYGGDPMRVFIWAHSAGNAPVGAYLTNAQTHLPTGHGLAGAVLMGATSAILPPAVTAGFGKPPIPLLIAAGEIDLPAAVALVEGMETGSCATGSCATTMILRGHSHMSAVFSPNTADLSVTAPVLAWLRSVK